MTFIIVIIGVGLALLILSRVIERERDLEELEYKIRSLEMEHIYDEQVEEATKAWQSWRDYSESE